MSIESQIIQNMFKSVDRELTDGQLRFLENKFRNNIRITNDHCIDNFRICVGSEMTKQYKEQRDNGCCGFSDDKVTLKNGKTFIFGFNYGH